MDFIKKIFSSECDTIQFVTTKSIGYYIEKMFEDAKEKIFIISPYIKISPRIYEILDIKSKNGLDITIVYRENFDSMKLPVKTFRRDNLHAKCFLTEKYALVGSMNLYDYSQINNDEMGFIVKNNGKSSIFSNIQIEAQRLCTNFIFKNNELYFNNEKIKLHSSLVIGVKYYQRDLEKYFSFVNEHKGGIRQTKKGNIVLFMYSSGKYSNEKKDGIIYYVGQNTGGEEQQLIFGNKILYDCFYTKQNRIFLFEDNIFMGEYNICMKPFMKEKKWIFPLIRKQ